MTPVQPEELSALMDGELSPSRAREVERQIANDPGLRAEFERLVAMDARWRAAAATAAFTPAVHLPPHSTHALRPAMVMVALTLTLIALRMAPRWSESLSLGFGLHAAALTVLLAGLLWVARTDVQERGPDVGHITSRHA